MKINLLTAFLFLWLMTTVRSETTSTPTPMVAEHSESELTTSKLPEIIDAAQNEVQQSVVAIESKKPAEEIVVNLSPITGQLGPNLANVPPSPHRPINSLLPPIPPMQFQLRVPPPFFGTPFKPSVIRSLAPSFVALPPRDQPNFDSLCQHQGSSAKRDLERPRPLQFGGFYLSSKNQDVLFSVCGSLAPAHLILIEPVSSKFGQFISTRTKNGTNHDPIVINGISDLLDQLLAEQQSNVSTTNSSIPLTNSCADKDFEAAFKLFLKFFYVGEQAFEDIQNLDVGILVWKLGVAFLDIPGTVQQQIEPRLGRLLSLDTLGQMYRFATVHQIAFLNQKWSEFIAANSRMLAPADTDRLPLTCADIDGDILYLDRFMEALNVNQSTVISYIRQYLRICPESANFNVTSGSNPFPRSLLYYRCTLDDLKELVKIGFLNYEALAEELENRLRVNERHCDEKCAAKFAPLANYRHVMPLNPGTSHSLGRRA